MTLTIVLLFVALATGLFALVSGWSHTAEGKVIKERIAAIDQAVQRDPREDLGLLRDELLSAIPALNRLLSKSARISNLQKYLWQAAINMRPGKFLLFAACLGAVMGLVASLLGLSWWMLPLATALGVAIPFLYVSKRRKNRFFRFESKFHDTIDLMVRALRAGHSLTAALEMMANESPEPLAGEFRKVFEEQKFGMPVRDALLNLTDRVPTLDVKFFVTGLLLQRETGGNLAELLDKLSYVIRERFKLMRQVRVFTAHGRMTMMILMGLPIGWVMLIGVTSPDYLKPMYTDSLGHVLIGVGVGLQTIGYLLIRKIINIQV